MILKHNIYNNNSNNIKIKLKKKPPEDFKEENIISTVYGLFIDNYNKINIIMLIYTNKKPI